MGRQRVQLGTEVPVPHFKCKTFLCHMHLIPPMPMQIPENAFITYHYCSNNFQNLCHHRCHLLKKHVALMVLGVKTHTQCMVLIITFARHL